VRTPKFTLEREHRRAVFEYETEALDWRFTGY
jgi:hypothetical protein